MKSRQSCHLHLLTDPPLPYASSFSVASSASTTRHSKDLCSKPNRQLSEWQLPLYSNHPPTPPFTAHMSPNPPFASPASSTKLLNPKYPSPIYPRAILSPAECSLSLLLSFSASEESELARGKSLYPPQTPCGFRSSQLLPSLTRFINILSFSALCFLMKLLSGHLFRNPELNLNYAQRGLCSHIPLLLSSKHGMGESFSHTCSPTTVAPIRAKQAASQRQFFQDPPRAMGRHPQPTMNL